MDHYVKHLKAQKIAILAFQLVQLARYYAPNPVLQYSTDLISKRVEEFWNSDITLRPDEDYEVLASYFDSRIATEIAKYFSIEQLNELIADYKLIEAEVYSQPEKPNTSTVIPFNKK